MILRTDDIDESSFRTVSSRDIEIDDENSAKINIILTGGEKMTPYTQVWKVEFPPNTVKTTPGQIPNSGPLTTLGVRKPKLTGPLQLGGGNKSLRKQQMVGTQWPYQRGVQQQNLGNGGRRFRSRKIQ